MRLFNMNADSFLDVIRCDENEYLIHKWTPNGKENSTDRENSIRYGSRLHVREGEAAIFVYPQENGKMHDYIPGPVDRTIHTDNFPVLSNIVGSLFGGSSPFVAEIYFCNLQGNLQIKFGIPYFDVFDNRFPDLGIPCAVRGTLTFNITDFTNFIKLYRLIGFDLDDLKDKLKDFFIRKAKSIILNIPSETGLSVMQLERSIDNISDYIQEKIRAELQDDFGVNLKRLDISALELEKNHPHYQQLKEITIDQQTKYINAKTGIEITNLEELARIQRKDAEMGVEGKHFTVHKLNQQTDVLKTAAENLGKMGSSGSIDGEGGIGFNPIGLMTGMAIGNTMGNQMSGMMSNIPNTPPPTPETSYHIAINGKQSGPFSTTQLKEMAQNGQFTKDYYIWKQGMDEWVKAETTPELSELFSSVPPPPPPPSI